MICVSWVLYFYIYDNDFVLHFRETFQTDEGQVSGLAIDEANQRLYWSSDDTINFAGLRKDGKRQQLIKTGAKISGITVHAGAIYWAESEGGGVGGGHGGGRVLRADAANGRGRTLVLSSPSSSDGNRGRVITDLLVFDAKFNQVNQKTKLIET